MYFPVEMVLMVKALVTFEGVGQILQPGFDVAAVSQKHVNAIFMQQFSPWRLAKDSLRGAPEWSTRWSRRRSWSPRACA